MEFRNISPPTHAPSAENWVIMSPSHSHAATGLIRQEQWGNIASTMGYTVAKENVRAFSLH